MFTRSILIPSLLVCAIAAPFLLSEPGSRPPDEQNQQAGGYGMNGEYGAGAPFAGYSGQAGGNSLSPQTIGDSGGLASTHSVPTYYGTTGWNGQVAGNQAGVLPSHQTVVGGNGQAVPGNPRLVPFGLVSESRVVASPGMPGGAPSGMAPVFPGGAPVGPGGVILPSNGAGFPVTPDLHSAQTVILPGNEFGPDLNAAPLEFLPVTDFSQVFRFDIDQNWVKRRWKRVSAVPGGRELHGLRVALVTGTNSWDLHGALTYYFDTRQQVARITFRGWTGDPTRLTQFLTQQYEFKPQQTNLAGFYVAKKWRRTTGALLMKNPPVISRDNPTEQVALVLEINHPDGKFELSDDMVSLIQGSYSR